MIKILFLLLVVMSSAAFAQTEDSPKAVKFDEFETAANGYVKWRMDSFYVELNNNPASQGYIINYGTDREIIIREKQIRVSIQWRKFDATRITFVQGGLRETVKTELWRVPPGAENPQPISDAEIIDSFGKIPDGELKARLDGFLVSLGNKPNSKGYILIHGSAKENTAQAARIKRYIGLRKFDLSRIIFKNAGLAKIEKTELWLIPEKDKKESKTQFWIVPPGAKPPTREK
jgi:hypothetical protein